MTRKEQDADPSDQRRETKDTRTEQPPDAARIEVGLREWERAQDRLDKANEPWRIGHRRMELAAISSEGERPPTAAEGLERRERLARDLPPGADLDGALAAEDREIADNPDGFLSRTLDRPLDALTERRLSRSLREADEIRTAARASFGAHEPTLPELLSREAELRRQRP